MSHRATSDLMIEEPTSNGAGNAEADHAQSSSDHDGCHDPADGCTSYCRRGSQD